MRVALFAVSLVIFIATALHGQTLQITGGVTNDQVLQRDAGDTASVAISGFAQNADGRQVEVRIVRAHFPVENFDWKAGGVVRQGAWNTTLPEVPTGGPYRIEARIAGTDAVAAVQNVLVGDLWILGGQSNMEGVGDLIGVTPPHAMVHYLDQTDMWGVAEEPLHRLPDAADRVHWRKNNAGELVRLSGEELRKFIASRKKGAGLGLPFAVEMVRRTGVPVGLIPCAHGGTSMDQWDPSLRDKGGDSLYGAMYRRFLFAGGKLKGMLWYQGESDANVKAAPEFQGKFERLVAAIRQDFKQPELPFYYVQIGLHIEDADGGPWNVVQEAQRRAENSIPRTGMVASIDATLDDQIHVGTQDLKRLGRQLANRACHDLFPQVAECANLLGGPRPMAVRRLGERILVEFSGVNDALAAEGRVYGFALEGPDGKLLPRIYKQEIDGDRPSVIVLSVRGEIPVGSSLRYGVGRYSYCNVKDKAGMTLPVFGPIPIE